MKRKGARALETRAPWIPQLKDTSQRYHMSELFDKFIVVYQEYFLASGQDIECAAILKLIESLSKASSGEKTSWVSVSAKAVEKLTFGVIPKRGVSRKINTLKSKGLIDVRLQENNWPSYKLNLDSIREMAMIEFKKQGPEDDKPTQNVHSTDSTIQETPYTQNVLRVCTKCVDINSIENSIKKKERTPHLTDIVESTVDVDLTCLPNRKEENLGITVLIEKEHQHEEQRQSEENSAHEGEEEKNMNEEVRALLKSYDKIPRNKRTDICKKSITALYQKHGDDLEKKINLYGFDECMKALENYKADEFWESKGFPISGYIKQIERFLENTSGNPAPYRGVGKKEKIAPRPESAQIPAIPAAKIDDDPNAEYRKMVRAIRMRVGEVTTMVKITTPEKLAEFEQLTRDLATVNPVVIEEWFSLYSELWKQKHGGFAYKGLSKPLC